MDQTKIFTYGMTDIKDNKISTNQGLFSPNLDVLKIKSENSSTKTEKRRRRGKKECEGRDFLCSECGKAYLSAPALMQHRKTKHNYCEISGEKRGRGRPRKVINFT
jgi:hypothetical protein